jgi:cytoskeletal protein CcmA (bactofilin family)
MNHMKLAVVGMVLVVVALMTGCVGQIVTSGHYTLASGDTVRGDLLITSGDIVLEEGSRVTGTVFMTSGNLDIDGVVGGDVLLTSGNVNLGPDAVVRGDILGTSGNVRQADGARVEGRISTNAAGPNVAGGYVMRLLAQVCGIPLILLGVLIYLLAGRGRSKPAASPEPAPADPAHRIAQLKSMLDDGLLTEAEYEAKKADILARM